MNVAIAEEPVVPSLPVWSVGLISLVGFVTALGTGAGVAFAADYLDPALAWTGVKDSGHGCTLSRLGYETLTRPKSFHLRTRF